MTKILNLCCALVVLSVLSCENIKQEEQAKEGDRKTVPENIILLIGDGMGLSQASITFYYGEESVFTRFPYTGLVRTSSKSDKITDSAAGGTAFSSGRKTFNGAVGVDTDSSNITNISELLAETHKIGLIATSSITHATPAAFYAHVSDRNMEYEIARQLQYSTVDYFAAGGYKYFSERPDRKNLLDSLEEKGFVVDTGKILSKDGFTKDKKYGFLPAAEAMPVASKRGDFLSRATIGALDYFDVSGNPFFLMVEASQIDWAGHENDTEYMIGEVLDFQDAVKVAREYAERNSNTLVIVTADHETGGFTLSADYENKEDYNKLTPAFATGGHSAALVPLFAFGPGAENFTGVFENTDVFHKIMELIQE